MVSDKKSKGKRTLILALAIGVVLSFGVYKCKYYYSRWSDYRNSPWAYSKDENAKLLVGKWQGTFQDPDKIGKTINLEIFVPMTEEEREDKAAKRWKRASHSTRNKGVFEGVATVTSRLGTEKYEIYGSVDKTDFHLLHFSFSSEAEKKRILPNFALLEATQGHWEQDELTLTFGFSYQKADGSSFSSSADPRHDTQAIVNLKRTSSL